MSKCTYIRFQSGFTIVELLIVIVVVAILAAVSVASYTGIQSRAHDSVAEQNISTLIKTIAMKHASDGDFSNFSGIGHLAITLAYDSVGAPDLDRMAYLASLGVDVTSLRYPAAPNGVSQSLIFNSDTDGNGPLLSSIEDSESIEVAVVKDVPSGYASWEDVFTEFDDIYNEFFETYLIANPQPDGGAEYTEWDQWYESLDIAFTAAHPEQAAIVSEGTHVNILVPKTSFYFVDFLGASGASSKDCITHAGSGLNCEGDEIVTGIRIHYYSNSSKSWKQKQVGSGESYRSTQRYYSTPK